MRRCPLVLLSLVLLAIPRPARAQPPAHPAAPRSLTAPLDTLPAPAPSVTGAHLVMPLGQTEDIVSASFSPDGKRMIVVSMTEIKLWETSTGTQLTDATFPHDILKSATFSPDGKKVLIQGSDSACIWDAIEGRMQLKLKVDGQQLVSASFSPDGRQILTAWGDGRLRIYETRTGRLLHAWTVIKRASPGDAVLWGPELLYTALFSPDGKTIFFNGAVDAPGICDAGTGKVLMRLKGIPDVSDREYWQFQYSPDGRRLIALSGSDSTVKIFNAITGTFLFSCGVPKDLLRFPMVSPNGKRLLTSSDGGIARIWSMKDGQLLQMIRDSSKLVDAHYSPDGNSIVAARDNGTILFFDATARPVTSTRPTSITANFTRRFPRQEDLIYWSVLSSDGQLLATISYEQRIKIWDIPNGRLLSELKGHAPQMLQAFWSPDKKTILSFTDAGNYTWDGVTSHLIGRDSIGGLTTAGCWDSAGERLVTFTSPDIAEVWDVKTGRSLMILKGHTGPVRSASFSPDGKRLLTASEDSTAKIWDAASGACLLTLRGHKNKLTDAAFSPDGAMIATASADSTVRVWASATSFSPPNPHPLPSNPSSSPPNPNPSPGALLLDLRKHTGAIRSVAFSPDGSAILSVGMEGMAILWDAKTGNVLHDFGRQNHSVTSAIFSPDGSAIFLAAQKGAAIWDVKAERLELLYLNRMYSLPGIEILSAQFSNDGKRLVIADYDSLYIYDALPGQGLPTHRVAAVPIPTGAIQSAQFGPDARTILTCGLDNTFKIWDASTGRLLYSCFAVDSSDYLVYDKDSRYDGTEGARKYLYYTCGTEVISLDQVKNQLWVPNLAAQLLAGDNIEAPRLSDLQICGLVPVVEGRPADAAAWHFLIHPRTGGLGQVVLYVNGNETRRYAAKELQHTTNGYALTVPKQQLADLLVPGQDNPITVKAFTAAGALSSRGATVTSPADTTHHPAPNLYAVMVGISDYKGDELDLAYAAKDAADLSRAIETAAKSWLERDGHRHVFMYNLTTNKNHDRLPGKEAIRQTLEDIAKKARAADILLIFFAGHGVMAGDVKRQFYLLTADASPETSGGSAAATVGISTPELSDWIYPSRIKAQKRILILDACNSGQLINEIVTFNHPQTPDGAHSTGTHSLGKVRNNDNAEQTRSIDQLNDQSGLFILAASASNQSAYEISRYSQGVLTYALLKAIRDDPAILDAGRYLNVGPWFDHAKKTVTDLVRENGARQQPQILTTTSFDIGIVDSAVQASIHLASENTRFTQGNFINRDETVGGDDIDLTPAIDQVLNSVSSRGAGADIAYIPAASRSDAWYLSGSYTIKDTAVTVSVNIWHNKKNLWHFPVKGNRNDINTLAVNIVSQALAWITANKPQQ